jgi:hypothetical protein
MVIDPDFAPPASSSSLRQLSADTGLLSITHAYGLEIQAQVVLALGEYMASNNILIWRRDGPRGFEKFLQNKFAKDFDAINPYTLEDKYPNDEAAEKDLEGWVEDSPNKIVNLYKGRTNEEVREWVRRWEDAKDGARFFIEEVSFSSG